MRAGGTVGGGISEMDHTQAGSVYQSRLRSRGGQPRQIRTATDCLLAGSAAPVRICTAAPTAPRTVWVGTGRMAGAISVSALDRPELYVLHGRKSKLSDPGSLPPQNMGPSSSAATPVDSEEMLYPPKHMFRESESGQLIPESFSNTSEPTECDRFTVTVRVEPEVDVHGPTRQCGTYHVDGGVKLDIRWSRSLRVVRMLPGRNVSAVTSRSSQDRIIKSSIQVKSIEKNNGRIVKHAPPMLLLRERA
ncbi:hypothetical protein EXIGLDRAFT_233410 [Exidia glandulosa HHB12029]|uniref:Uncharacterized protein n=1 Tax=Exidia glandulosa HHB12029 TaxID=1314781 RepID=A0A165ZVI0_EXIGL|nr:hypothetical protein EXIGLDRAFT_233410 [Exidia glandulosa HHB12029]